MSSPDLEWNTERQRTFGCQLPLLPHQIADSELFQKDGFERALWVDPRVTPNLKIIPH